MSDLQTVIDAAWDDRNAIGPDTKGEVRLAVDKALSALDSGEARIAEKVAVSQSMGTLTLSLRSIADNTAELERAVAAGEVRLPPGTNPAEERKLLLSVANRPNDSNTTYTTGGDVSRFQRRKGVLPALVQPQA